MSVAEMKLAAIAEISKIQSEVAIKEILEHLARLSAEVNPSFDVTSFFDKKSAVYGDVLKKLA